MPYLTEFLTVASIHLLAVMSPGPDFAMISRNALSYSRRTGLYSAAGLAIGIMMHVTYSLVGIGLIISRSILLFSAIKYLGAGYLVYLGWKALTAKAAESDLRALEAATTDISRAAALRMGFLTNALNPKVTLFFLSVFTQVISPLTPKLIQVSYGVEMAVMTFAWFALVATLLSHGAVKRRFVRVQRGAERVFGVVLIAFGIKVALAHRQ